MNTYTSGRAIRLLGTLIRIARVLLIAGSVFTLILAIFAVAGTASMSVNGQLDQFTLELEDGRAVMVSGDNRSYTNIAEDARRDFDIDSVIMEIAVDEDDLDTRVALSAVLLGSLAVAWIVVNNLGRLVRSAESGNAFGPESPRWFRNIGAATLAGAALTIVGGIIVGATLDTTLDVDIAIGGAPTWLLIAFGLGMYALAEVFAEGVRLREFEDATV